MRIILAFLVLAGLSPAGDWPQFKRDGQRTGNAVSEAIHPPLRLNTAVSLGAPVLSSPAVVNDKAYVQTENGRVSRIDGPGNHADWTVDIGGTGNYSSPCVVNGRIYVGSTADSFFVLDTADGGRIKALYAPGGVVTSAAYANNAIYWLSWSGRLVKMDLDGNILATWQDDSICQYRTLPSPYKMSVGYGHLDFAIKGNRLVLPVASYRGLTDNGSSFSVNWTVGGYSAMPAFGGVCFADNDVFGTSEFDREYGSTILANALTGVFLKDGTAMGFGEGLLATSRSAPSARGNVMFFACGAAEIASYNTQSSTLLWKTTTVYAQHYESQPMRGPAGFQSSPALSDSLVVAASMEGSVYFIPINSSGNRDDLQVWTYLPRDTSLKNNGFFSSPAVSNGRVYWGGMDGVLYGLGPGPAVSLPPPAMGAESPAMGQGLWRLAVYPNPARETVNMAFDNKAGQRVCAGLYDLRGRLMRKLLDRNLPAGRYEIRWSGSGFPAGTYVLKVRAGSEAFARTFQKVK